MRLNIPKTGVLQWVKLAKPLVVKNADLPAAVPGLAALRDVFTQRGQNFWAGLVGSSHAPTVKLGLRAFSEAIKLGGVGSDAELLAVYWGALGPHVSTLEGSAERVAAQVVDGGVATLETLPEVMVRLEALRLPDQGWSAEVDVPALFENCVEQILVGLLALDAPMPVVKGRDFDAIHLGVVIENGKRDSARRAVVEALLGRSVQYQAGEMDRPYSHFSHGQLGLVDWANDLGRHAELSELLGVVYDKLLKPEANRESSGQRQIFFPKAIVAINAKLSQSLAEVAQGNKRQAIVAAREVKLLSEKAGMLHGVSASPVLLEHFAIWKKTNHAAFNGQVGERIAFEEVQRQWVEFQVQYQGYVDEFDNVLAAELAFNTAWNLVGYGYTGLATTLLIQCEKDIKGWLHDIDGSHLHFSELQEAQRLTLWSLVIFRMIAWQFHEVEDYLLQLREKAPSFGRVDAFSWVMNRIDTPEDNQGEDVVRIDVARELASLLAGLSKKMANHDREDLALRLYFLAKQIEGVAKRDLGLERQNFFLERVRDVYRGPVQGTASVPVVAPQIRDLAAEIRNAGVVVQGTASAPVPVGSRQPMPAADEPIGLEID